MKLPSLSATSPHGHPTICFTYWEKYLIIRAALLVCNHIKIVALLLPAFRQSYWLHAIVKACAWGLSVQNRGLWCMKKKVKIHFKQLLLLKAKPNQQPPEKNNNSILSSLKSQDQEHPDDHKILVIFCCSACLQPGVDWGIDNIF